MQCLWAPPETRSPSVPGSAPLRRIPQGTTFLSHAIPAGVPHSGGRSRGQRKAGPVLPPPDRLQSGRRLFGSARGAGRIAPTSVLQPPHRQTRMHSLAPRGRCAEARAPDRTEWARSATVLPRVIGGALWNPRSVFLPHVLHSFNPPSLRSATHCVPSS